MEIDNTADSRTEESPARWFIDAVLHAYSIVFFTQKRWVGICLLLATFVAPNFGAHGIFAVVLTVGVGGMLGFDRAAMQDGRLVFNSLLVGMTVAYLGGYQDLEFTYALMVLSTASVLSLFVSATLNHLVFNLTGLPAMSLPFVVVSLALFFLYFSINWTPVVASSPGYLFPEPLWMPPLITAFFQSFGALLFIPHAGVGMFLFGALLFHSRLSVIYAIVGFTSGALFVEAFDIQMTPESLSWVSFNFVLTGISLGGGFFVPSRSSLLLVVLGGFFCGAIAIAVRSYLLHFNIPPLALPFNLVVLMMVYALRMRTKVKTLHAAPLPGWTPEENFRRFAADGLRFDQNLTPILRAPFSGECVVTQGVNGGITHRQQWAFALDFEMRDYEGNASNPPNSPHLEDYFTFGTPVLSPCAGRVVKVVADVPDNLPGGENFQHNWGNLVIIKNELGGFVKLSHFRHQGVTISEGDHVIPGALIGYCGNSGRSPLPHLHLQMQESDEVGAGSIPFRLANYREWDDGRWKFVRAGLPDEGTRLRSLNPDPRLSSCFSDLIHREFSFAVSSGDASHEETIRCRPDAWGNFLFESVQRKSQLTARVIKDVFTVLDIHGDRESVLLLAWPALNRIPLFSADGLHWEEQLDPSVTKSPARRLWSDLVEPFFGLSAEKIDVSQRVSPPSDSIAAKRWEVKVISGSGTEVSVELEERNWMHGGRSNQNGALTQWTQIPR